MDRLAASAISTAMLLLAGAASAEAQTDRSSRSRPTGRRMFTALVPAKVTARPGDVLIFKAVRGSPHSIVFEGRDLSEATHEAMNGAMSRPHWGPQQSSPADRRVRVQDRGPAGRTGGIPLLLPSSPSLRRARRAPDSEVVVNTTSARGLLM